jgi:predicted dehydrogenase
MIKVGIIGAGFMGQTHAGAYAKIPDVQVAYLADASLERAQKLAQSVGAAPTTRAAELLQDATLDLVDVCLPTPLHPEYAIAGLQAGKHVVLEKPLALTLADADRILAAAEQSQHFLMVAHVLRFWPEYLAIQGLLESGRLGAPLLAQASRLSNMPQWADWFRDASQTGGVLLDLSIHDLDMLNWLFGPPRQVYARGIKNMNGDWGHVVTQVDYAMVLASAEASYQMPADFPFTASLRVVCEKGVVEYLFRAGGGSFEQGQPEHYLKLHEPGKPNQSLPFEPGDGFEREIACFVDCVRTGQTPRLGTPGQARLAVQTALAARTSLEQGRAISLPMK